ncbi:2-dehydropantoate 2-reductase [Candidatus Marinamargulisbacteria bacterium SCGC AAA071-K20]|nr:2-dehydropantoate 2-reductase [Candidatus Marinamargulisbacteria bacterium SCGC AAA071-K20]
MLSFQKFIKKNMGLSSKSPQSVLVLGAGAIGSLFGWKLAQAGLDVCVTARSDYKHIKQKGIQIQSIWGNDTFVPSAVTTLDELPLKPVDYLLISTKSIPAYNLHSKIKHLVSKGTSIVLLQNGIGIENEFALTFPQSHIISGLAFVCVTKTKPGLVEHKDYGRLVFGDFPTEVSGKTQSLIDAFSSVNVPCKGSTTIQRERWKKLLWNAPFNPISVVGGGISTKEILENETTFSLTKKVMSEVFNLAKADGYPLSDNAIERNIDDTKLMVPYKTSMLIDYEHKRELETEVILGNAIRLGKKFGVETTGMQSLYQQLLDIPTIKS